MAATRTTQRKRGATRRRTTKMAVVEEVAETEETEVSQPTQDMHFFRPIHFEINADDVDRAVNFYQDVFGWDIKKYDDPSGEMIYYLVNTGSGTEYGVNGAIMPRIDFHASTINTISVPDRDEYVEKVVNAGGKLISKSEIPNVGSFAYVMDSEGNILGILTPVENMMEM
jgi:hypothetical protein